MYPSTFTREPDSYGDVIAKGAFAKGIEHRRKHGIQLPGLFGHRMDDPDFYVARALEEGEDDHGWWVRGVFDLTSPKGPQVYNLVKSGLLRELSFAFEARSEGKVDLGGGRRANELRDLDVFEFSFVPVGANRDTSVVAIKNATRLVPGSRARALIHIAQLRM
ncbi:Putative prohead protease [Leucobacter sp. 7(1)]|nr:Putative prohead protease [Leucobacter sp. 7(1)]